MDDKSKTAANTGEAASGEVAPREVDNGLGSGTVKVGYGVQARDGDTGTGGSGGPKVGLGVEDDS
jgi:hypothetical protein